MSDLVSLVIGVPNVVEGFVKLARVVRKLESLENDHVEAIEDAIFCAETLKYYAGFLDVNNPDVLRHPSRPLLERALAHAYDALNTAQRVLNEWNLRLQPPEDKAQKHDIAKKLRTFLSQKLLNSASKEDAAEPVESHAGSKLFTKAAYLAIGAVEIKESMGRLNKWMLRFGQLLLTSPSLRLQDNDRKKRGDMAENVAFVARARDRVAAKREVPVVELHHLNSVFDIDPEHNSGIFRLDAGDFAGYIVDVRDPFLRNSRMSFEAEVEDTLRICRLAAETISDKNLGARASVGILPCAGYALRVSPPTHYLLFHLPPGLGSPCTLRSLLLSGPPHHSLNSRLEFCKRVVTSVLIIHSLGLVHKNIRPDSILVANDLRSDHNESILGTPFLVAFGQARLVQGTSSQRTYKGEHHSRNLYVHPRHSVPKRTVKWQMRDDIYSLGICLFEVAIWRSLLVWDPEERGLVGDFGFLPLSDEHYDSILNRQGKSIHEDRTWMRRSDLIKYASDMIPATMGETFRSIVVDCLQFGDSKIETQEDDLGAQEGEKDPDSIKAVLFVEEILAKLQNLVFAF